MSDEWGPWIEHDGKGCPCVGQWVQSERNQVVVRWTGSSDAVIAGRIVEYRPPPQSFGSWHWTPGFCRVIRYRIRKPRGLTILENLLADLPAPQPGKVDA